MELKNIEQIEEGMVVFMPSGIQATLHKDGQDILVKYPELYEDRYNKKDFEEIINEGIIIFNEPSVIMEALEQDYKLTIIVGRDRDSNGKLKEVSFKAKNDVDAFLQVLAKYDTCCSGYFNGDYEGELDPEELERDQKIKAAAETGVNQEEVLQILSDLYNETMDISDYYDDIVTLTAPDGHIVFEDDIDVDEWFEDEEYNDEDDFDESLKEAYENAKNPEGSIFKAMKDKDVEIVTAEFKNEALTALTKIAKEFPDGHVRQQALTFMDELGLQEYYDLKAVRKFIDKHLEKLAEFNSVNESLNEEKGELADNDNLKHIAKDLEDGLKSGKELNEFGNWICETSLDEKWETLTKEMKDYILENISYPVADGHVKYYDLNVLFYGDSFTKEDLMSLDTFTEEEILEAKAEEKELQIFMTYEIKYDSNLEEAFKEKKKSKKKLDEINKDGKMNEDCYKVYNSLCPECDPVSLGSWNEVEEYLNSVWGEYKADRCKENNEFGSEQDREEFMGSFDVAFIEPVEVIEVPTEEQEIVEEPELTKEEVEEIKDEVEDCLDQLENEVKDDEELQEAFANADLEYEFKTVRRNALANPNLYGGKYTQKNIKDARKEFLADKQPKNEDFTDNMGMLTDVNDVDMPDALKASIPVTKDGEVLTPDKYAQEIENLKQLITSLKTDLLTEIKNEIKMTLMDVKNDIKTDVNDVENKVDDTKDAVDNLTMEAEVAEEIEEEPLEEEPAAEEEQVEESYVNPLKQFLKKGMIEDIAKVKSEIDKAVVQGKSAEEVKNTITLLADDEKEQEEASQYALNKMTESLLRHSQDAPLAGIATIQTGLTLK